MVTTTSGVPSSDSTPGAPSLTPAASKADGPRAAMPGRGRLAAVLIAAIAGGSMAGGAVGMAAGWRASSPVILGEVDRDVVSATLRGGQGTYVDGDRRSVTTALRDSFLTLERLTRRLDEPVVREVVIDGLDVVDDLRVEDIDPILAARVDLLPMQDAINFIERTLGSAVEAAAPTAADLRAVRAAVSDAIVRTTETRILIERFTTRVDVRGGLGGNRPSTTAPIALLEAVLLSLDRRLDRAVDELREAGDAAWRSELRARFAFSPGEE